MTVFVTKLARSIASLLVAAAVLPGSDGSGRRIDPLVRAYAPLFPAFLRVSSGN